MNLTEAIARLREAAWGQPNYHGADVDDRVAMRLVLAALDRLASGAIAGGGGGAADRSVQSAPVVMGVPLVTPEAPSVPLIGKERAALSVVDGTSSWDPKVVTDLRARFEKAILECDRIVIFSARKQGMQLVVDANSDTRVPALIAWFEMLGFMQAKLNNWMREMLEG